MALCDLDAGSLRITTQVIQRMIDERGMPYRLESSTQRRDLLDSADFVVVAIAIDHRRLWTIDLDIAQRHSLILTTGDPLGQVWDYFGNSLEDVPTPFDGDVLAMTTAMAVSAARLANSDSWPDRTVTVAEFATPERSRDD